MCSRGEFGRLGHGDTKGRLSPTKVDSLARVDVVAVSAGGRYVCVSTMSVQGGVCDLITLKSVNDLAICNPFV